MNTNEKAQSAEELHIDVIDQDGFGCLSRMAFEMAAKEYTQSRISQLEQDLAKSQEKCKKYEGALEETVSLIEHTTYDIGSRYEEILELAEQALKPDEHKD